MRRRERRRRREGLPFLGVFNLDADEAEQDGHDLHEIGECPRWLQKLLRIKKMELIKSFNSHGSPKDRLSRHQN